MNRILPQCMAVLLAFSPLPPLLPSVPMNAPTVLINIDEQALSSVKPFYGASMGSSGSRDAGHLEAQAARSLTNLESPDRTDQESMRQIWNQMVRQFFQMDPTKTVNDLWILLERDKDMVQFARRIALRGIYDGTVLHRYSLSKNEAGDWSLTPIHGNIGGRCPSGLIEVPITDRQKNVVLVRALRDKIVVRSHKGNHAAVEKGSKLLNTLFRNLENQELSPQEITLFAYLVTGQGRKLWIYYEPDTEELLKHGGSATRDEIRFRGPVADTNDLRSILEILKHEAAHALSGDAECGDSRMNDAGVFYREWRANLWAMDGDVDRALEATFRSYSLQAERMMEFFPPRTSNERMYRALSLLDQQTSGVLPDAFAHFELRHRLQLILDQIPSGHDEAASEASVIVAVENLFQSLTTREDTLDTQFLQLLGGLTVPGHTSPEIMAIFLKPAYQNSMRNPRESRRYRQIKSLVTRWTSNPLVLSELVQTLDSPQTYAVIVDQIYAVLHSASRLSNLPSTAA